MSRTVLLIVSCCLCVGCADWFANSAKHQRRLTVFAANGDEVALREQLAIGTNPDARNENGDPAIRRAALKSQGHCVNLLLAHGANPNLANKEGRTALHEAAALADLGMIVSLAEAGADLNAGDLRGVTPFMEAIGSGHTTALDLLLEYGANIPKQMADGQLPLSTALTTGHRNVVTWLMTQTYASLPADDQARVRAHAEGLGQLSWLEGASLKKARTVPAKSTLKVEFNDPPPYTASQIRDRVLASLPEIKTVHPTLQTLAEDLVMALVHDRYQPIQARKKQGDDRPKLIHQTYREQVYTSTLFTKRTMSVVNSKARQNTVWSSEERVVQLMKQQWQPFPETMVQHGLAIHISPAGRIYAVWNAIEPSDTPKATAIAHADIQSWRSALYGALNHTRQSQHLAPLQVDDRLQRLASAHNQDMVDRRFFANVTPDGMNARKRAAAMNMPLDIRLEDCLLKLNVGELITDIALPAGNTAKWANRVMVAQLEQASSARHLLNPIYSHVGLGIAQNRTGRLFVTQYFYFQPDLETSFRQVAKRNPPDLDLQELEKLIHSFVNRTRAIEGQTTLHYNQGLVRLARAHSKDMATNRYFDHRNQNGETASDRAERLRVRSDGQGIAENLYKESVVATLAVGLDKNGDPVYIPTYRSLAKMAERIVSGWMQSPGHRANLMDPNIRHQGIGLALNKQLELHVTQNMY